MREQSRGSAILAILLMLAGCAPESLPMPPVPMPVASVPLTSTLACFVPGQDCAGLIEAEIGSARSEVLVQAYGFTSRPIADSLVAAERRGIVVRAILDKSALTARGSRLAELEAAGVPVLIDTVRGIAHNKVIIIDDRSVITGSYNFTDAAQHRNAENVLVIRDPAIAPAYHANWQRRALASYAAPKT